MYHLSKYIIWVENYSCTHKPHKIVIAKYSSLSSRGSTVSVSTQPYIYLHVQYIVYTKSCVHAICIRCCHYVTSMVLCVWAMATTTSTPPTTTNEQKKKCRRKISQTTSPIGNWMRPKALENERTNMRKYLRKIYLRRDI